MAQDLSRKKVFKGLLWSTIEKVGVQFVGFVLGIILARMLSPDDYGLMGMILIFIALSQIFVDSGISQALIQRQNRTDKDFNTAFVFNIGMSLFLYVLLFLCAPFVSAFYDKPILTRLLRYLSINIILNAFAVVHRAKLNVDLNFKVLSIANFVGLTVGGTSGILLAYEGFGVWALVGQSTVSTLVNVFVLNVIVKWKPSAHFSMESFIHLFRFGSKLLISGVYATIFNNIYMVVIGKMYKADELGYYTRARNFTDLSSGMLTQVIQSVTFPLLSSLQHDKKKLVDVYRKVISLTSFVVVPGMTLLALLAKPLILLLLTEKWLPVVPLLQLLALARIVTPISVVNMNILNAIGRSDLFLKVDLFKLPITVVAMIITFPISIQAVVISMVITSYISYFINAYLPGRMLGYGAFHQLKDCAKTIVATIGMAAVVWLLLPYLSKYNAVALFGGGVIGVLSYLLFHILLQSGEFLYGKNIILSLFKRKKGAKY